MSRGQYRKRAEAGFVMLLVFAMAAMVAIGLYTQLPRAAFEAQREKESLLIMHGEAYKRAVQLYCRKMGRYPAKMEDLDNTQNIRFLRKHYIDPMTRKDEWRLLHMGPAGKLIDSKIETTKTDDQWHQGSITEFKSAATVDNGSGGPEAINLAGRKRPSDDMTLGPMGGNNTQPPSNEPPPLPGSTVPNNNNGTLVNGTPGSIPGGPPRPPNTPSWLTGGAPLPGMPAGMRNLTAPGGTPNAPANSANANANSGGSISGNGGYGSGSVTGNGGYGTTTPNPTPLPPAAGGFGGNPVNSQFQGQSPYSTNQGANMNANTGFGQQGQQTSPAQMINNILTSPRPGGAPAGIGGGMTGTVVGGLAGVASTYRGHGIKRYADQDEYQKWEFFYDFGSDMRGLNQQQIQQQQQPTNNPANSTASPFGGSGGFSNSTGGNTRQSPPDIMNK